MARLRRPGSTTSATAGGPAHRDDAESQPAQRGQRRNSPLCLGDQVTQCGPPEQAGSERERPAPPQAGQTRRIESWARTVQAIMTPVTSPAHRSSLPPWITHSGATGTSSAKLENLQRRRTKQPRYPGHPPDRTQAPVPRERLPGRCPCPRRPTLYRSTFQPVHQLILSLPPRMVVLCHWI